MNTKPKGLRTPRATFHRMLTKMLTKATSQEYWDLPCEDIFYWVKRKDTARIMLNGIWVAGSFARGATTCGDLDLILDVVKISGEDMPRRSTMRKHILGVYPHVTTCIGTPNKNNFHTEFPEAVLLWSPEQPDWQTALNSIKINKEAGHLPREHDIFPLRGEQFDCGSYGSIIDLYKKKIINWQWISSDVVHEQNTGKIRKFLNTLNTLKGKKSFEALADAVHYFCPCVPESSWDVGFCRPTQIKIGGYYVFTGAYPYINLDELDKPECSALVIVPHKTKRGPNGLWIIERGPKWVGKTGDQN